ncbi:Gfo/Idh/MocA family protein [Alteribacter keqinensis]|uniref:Gfo/Idh/MocA family oxidoreductase n=1 Tax=Alteribacter keqinensis TaxID=2483800 RepID=A0A3M7TTJ0_9BACI|nr:Gfo/Idh/MocA family oxidoreductase [Alteribacter keqinensis]RNA67673.1 gfo/Idh/MocA family oxidoreductase [Alteribacter keqinensis]
MNIGIISFAHLHAVGYAKAISSIPDVNLTGIAYEEDPEKGKEFADTFNTEFYSSVDALLHSEVEAVIITSENSRHVDHVVKAAKAKKHILCEKPIATTLEDGRKIMKVCKEEGVLFQTAFPVRYNTPVLEGKRIVESGALGTILAMKGLNRGTNPGGWFNDKELAGGGAVMDHTVHVTDIMRWYTGSEVKSVHAETGNLFGTPGVEDAGLLTLEFESGAFATLDCSWSRNEKYPTWGDVVLEVVGTQGNLKIDAFGQRLHVYSNENGTSWESWGDDMDKEMIQGFMSHVREGKEPSVTARDGYEALRVALAAYEASASKKGVVLER